MIISENERWMLVGENYGDKLTLVDIKAGKLHSEFELGGDATFGYGRYSVSSNKKYVLIAANESRETQALLLVTMGDEEPVVRTLFRKEGKLAQIMGFGESIWSPDGKAVAFLVSHPRILHMADLTKAGEVVEIAGIGEGRISISWLEGRPFTTVEPYKPLQP